MGHYHNKLDKKYFHKSLYAKKWEETFELKIKDIPLQYEIVFDTYNTFISLNNILFSLNYVPIKNKVDNIIHLLDSYLLKYKNKIKKSYDSNCILIYESFEETLDDLKEKKEMYEKNKNYKYNLKLLEKDTEQYMYILEKLYFDNLLDCKDMVFEKKPNDKLPKKVNLKLIDDTEQHVCTLFDINKQININTEFIENYSKIKFDLNENKEQREIIFEILNWIKDLNNAIVDYYIYDKDKTILNIFNSYLKTYFDNMNIELIKDVEFQNVYNRLKNVSIYVDSDDIEKAFAIIKDLIRQYKNLFERMS